MNRSSLRAARDCEHGYRASGGTADCPACGDGSPFPTPSADVVTAIGHMRHYANTYAEYSPGYHIVGEWLDAANQWLNEQSNAEFDAYLRQAVDR